MDPAIKKCETHIKQAREAVRRAWESLDGVEDLRKRAELEEQILNVGYFSINVVKQMDMENDHD